MNKRTWMSALATVVMLVGVVPRASATLLAPGGGPIAPDVFAVSPGGTLLANTTVLPYTTSVYTGTYESSVYSDPLNLVCAGCLDFVYTFSNDASSADSIHRATVAVFSEFTTDVGYDNNSLGVAPTTVDRSLSGSVIGFNFPDPTGNGRSWSKIENAGSLYKRHKFRTRNARTPKLAVDKSPRIRTHSGSRARQHAAAGFRTRRAGGR